MFFLLSFERNKVLLKHNAKARFGISLITSLCIEYIEEFMTLNQKDPMVFC